jgi:hypothetical protein
VAPRASKDRTGTRGHPGSQGWGGEWRGAGGWAGIRELGGREGGAGSYPDLPKVSRCTRSNWFRSLLNSSTEMRPESLPSTRWSLFAPGRRNAAMDRTIPNASTEQMDCIWRPGGTARAPCRARLQPRASSAQRSCHAPCRCWPSPSRASTRKDASCSPLRTNPPPQPVPPDPGICLRASPPSSLRRRGGRSERQVAATNRGVCPRAASCERGVPRLAPVRAGAGAICL